MDTEVQLFTRIHHRDTMDPETIQTSVVRVTMIRQYAQLDEAKRCARR